MANATISQIKVGNTTYDISDARVLDLYHITKYTIQPQKTVSVPHTTWRTIDTFFSYGVLGTQKLWMVSAYFSCAGGSRDGAWRRAYTLTTDSDGEVSTAQPSIVSLGQNFTQYCQLTLIATTDVYARAWHNFGSNLDAKVRLNILEFSAPHNYIETDISYNG